MHMRFGLFGGGKIGRLNPLGDSHGYQDFIKYIKDADRLGYESLFVVEHHFTGVGQLSASLHLLTYLAAVTRRIRLGTAVVVLPWHNPALLAEQVATLDVLSGGRVDFGIGRGYRKAEFEQFCIPMDEAQERFDECLEFILKAWTTEGRFTHEGKRWQYRNVVVEPEPTQKPHPPIWMAGGSPESITRVAKSNFNLLLDQVGSMALTLERLRTYLDTQEREGRPRDASRVGVARALNVVRTEAGRRKALERRAESLKNIGELARRPGSTDALVDDGALIGTPAEIIEKLQRLAEGGVEYVLLTNAVVTRESLQEFSEEIMPHLSDAPAPKAVRTVASG
jgi:alkanesulfonate monooxygenase SsuD/methylene tetrahydromethanopterin reductase-like flavin-dependent oxidoreductase (luciferase family)